MPIAGGRGTASEPDDAADPAPPRVLAALTAALERLVARNEGLAEAERRRKQREWEGKAALDAFRGLRAPNISVGRYLDRIHRYTGCSPSCFVVGFAYVDRLSHRHPSSLVLSVNVHRLILTAVMIASKVLDDVHHNSAFYAKVGGVSNAELNRMELELLFLLDFGLTVSSRVFDSYCLHLERELLCNGAGIAAGHERLLSDSVESPVRRRLFADDGEAPAAPEEAGEHDGPRSCGSSSSPARSF